MLWPTQASGSLLLLLTGGRCGCAECFFRGYGWVLTSPKCILIHLCRRTIFPSTLNPSLEANLCVWVEVRFGGKGIYFRVRNTHKSFANAQICCLLPWEKDVDILPQGLKAVIWYLKKEGIKQKKTRWLTKTSPSPQTAAVVGHARLISRWHSFNSFLVYRATLWPCGSRLMKSFSSDEGYQAPCSPHLIEQEFYIANYAVCITLVSTAQSQVGMEGFGLMWYTCRSKVDCIPTNKEILFFMYILSLQSCCLTLAHSLYLLLKDRW